MVDVYLVSKFRPYIYFTPFCDTTGIKKNGDLQWMVARPSAIKGTPVAKVVKEQAICAKDKHACVNAFLSLYLLSDALSTIHTL